LLLLARFQASPCGKVCIRVVAIKKKLGTSKEYDSIQRDLRYIFGLSLDNVSNPKTIMSFQSKDVCNRPLHAEDESHIP
jgi:hypothetical protein